MGSITGTKQLLTEFSGTKKLVVLTATMTENSSTIEISEADHGISSYDSIVGAVVTGGLDAAFSYIQATRTDSDTITVSAFEQDGTVATDFTGTTISVSVIGS